MYKNNRIVLLVPAYNEEGKIGNVLKKVPRNIVDEVVVVNDGSIDRTKEEILANDGTIIDFTINQGLGFAFKALFAYAKAKKYDVAIIVGGDDQDDPSEIPKFLTAIIDEKYDLVQGSRYLGTTQDMPFIRWLTTKLYSVLFSLVAKQWVTDASTGYKGFKVSLLDSVDLSADWLNKKYGIDKTPSLDALVASGKIIVPIEDQISSATGGDVEPKLLNILGSFMPCLPRFRKA